MKHCAVLLSIACLFHMVYAYNNVRLPRTIRSRESDIIIFRKHENVTLDCRAKEILAVRLGWKKNGFQFNTNISDIHKELDDGTIIINNATEADEGHYECFAKCMHGTALSSMVDTRMAFIDSTTEAPVLEETVVEGMPFRIRANRRRSFPEPLISWCKATEINANCTSLLGSSRTQVADNGDLHFAYSLPDDGGIYRSFTYNPFLQLKILGCSTQITVTKNPAGDNSDFAPTLAFSSDAQTVAFVGGNVTLRCFFYGHPEPKIIWMGPSRIVRSARNEVNGLRTEFTITNITATDGAIFVCAGSNTKGNSTEQDLQLIVKDLPKFQTVKDSPYDVNSTEGEFVTFNCNASATPAANISWFQNGELIDLNNPPSRFLFSSDLKILTIRDVCRDCDDRESKSDMMVIQCNASNVNGFEFAQGYLNVLMKTSVVITSSKTNVSVDFTKRMEFVFRCFATSDPSTPPIVRWYMTKPFHHLVRDVPPYVTVASGTMTIRIDPKCSANCAKYLGEYSCIGDNGYSQANRTVTLYYQYKREQIVKSDEQLASWKIFLGAAAICLALLLVGIYIGFRSKRGVVGIYRRRKAKGRTSNPPVIYEDVADLPLDVDVSYDDTGLSIPLEKVKNAENTDQQQPNGHEEGQSESGKCPQPDEKSESLNTSLMSRNHEKSVTA